MPLNAVLKELVGEEEEQTTYVNRNLYGVSMLSRVKELRNSEQMLFLLFILDKISFSELTAGIQTAVTDPLLTSQVLIMMKSVKEEKNMKFSSNTISIKIEEGKKFAQQLTKENLSKELKDNTAIVAFGNCNLDAKSYEDALTFAQKERRFVRFVRWGHELQTVSLNTLLTRNLVRFLKTGKFVPSSIISHSISKVTTLLGATDNGNHYKLAFAAGFEMDNNGYVRKTSGGGSVKAGPAALQLPTETHRWSDWVRDGRVSVAAMTAGEVENDSSVSEVDLLGGGGGGGRGGGKAVGGGASPSKSSHREEPKIQSDWIVVEDSAQIPKEEYEMHSAVSKREAEGEDRKPAPTIPTPAQNEQTGDFFSSFACFTKLW